MIRSARNGRTARIGANTIADDDADAADDPREAFFHLAPCASFSFSCLRERARARPRPGEPRR